MTEEDSESIDRRSIHSHAASHHSGGIGEREDLSRQLDELAVNAMYYSEGHSPHDGSHHTAVATIPPYLRDAVISTYNGPFGCFRRLFGSRQQQRQHAERLPLIPVYHVGTSPAETSAVGSNVGDFLRRWIFGRIRRQYPNTYTFTLASFLTFLLVFGILGLYYTGNLAVLTIIARTLICQLMETFQPASLPSFCR